jgi:hypothetical protein
MGWRMPYQGISWTGYLILFHRHPEGPVWSPRPGGSVGGRGAAMDGRIGWIPCQGLSSHIQVYATGQHRFQAFCKDLGTPPLPTTEHQFCLIEGGLKHSTKTYLSSVMSLQIVADLGDPFVVLRHCWSVPYFFDQTPPSNSHCMHAASTQTILSPPSYSCCTF